VINNLSRGVESATADVDKDSYCIGETITVAFSDIAGTGIWVGIFRSGDITDFANLPGWNSGALQDWVLTCGAFDNCDVFPSSGTVQLTTNGLEANQYTIVVSEDMAALSAQAVTGPFSVTNCDAPTAAPIDLALNTVPTVNTPTDAVDPTEAPVVEQPSVLILSGDIDFVIQSARSQIRDLINFDNDLIGKVRTTSRKINDDVIQFIT
jgi:hypothetical protein